MIVQTMTNPCRMPNIDTKDTTMIPLSSMKNYEFDSNYEEVSIMVPRTLLDGKFGSKCINVVRTEPLGTSKKIAVEVTFDGLCKKRKNVEVYILVGKSFGRHESEPYPHFLINSSLDYYIQEDGVGILKDSMEIQSVLVDNPSAFESFYSPNFKIFIGNERIVMSKDDTAFLVRFGIGLPDNKLELGEGEVPSEVPFEVPSKPFKNLFKFMGASKSNFEIIKSVILQFIIRHKYYSTYASFGV